MPLRSASPKTRVRDAAGSVRSARTPRNVPRDIRAAERREAILAAALDEFSLNGFAATRLDDIAKRANVAKGTIYLYFRDKETLFQELLRAMLQPDRRDARGRSGAKPADCAILRKCCSACSCGRCSAPGARTSFG